MLGPVSLFLVTNRCRIVRHSPWQRSRPRLLRGDLICSLGGKKGTVGAPLFHKGHRPDMQPSSLVVFKIGPPPGPVVLDGCGVVDEGRVFFVAEIHAVGVEE